MSKPHNTQARCCWRAAGFPTTFAVGELWTYVQAPKAKGPWSRVLSAFELPDHGLIGLFAGAHRRRSPETFGGVHALFCNWFELSFAYTNVPCFTGCCTPTCPAVAPWHERDFGMSELRDLIFQSDDDLQGLLPAQCISVSCYEQAGIQHLVAATMQGILESLARTGMDLRALDGVTLTPDCAATSLAIQKLPEDKLFLETRDPPDTMEMARTVPVWRGSDLRFHIVMRAGIGIGLLGTDPAMQALALACIAHEAAHVEHEGRLYRTFPKIYGKPIPCGDRSRQTFLKAMDVWSEYAASRSSAMFRPEAAEEFESVFCCALEGSLTACKQRIMAYRADGNSPNVFVDIQQLFGDVFVYAGYFLGHLDGLGLNVQSHTPHASAVLREHPEISILVDRLGKALRQLWLTEYGWSSIEVFAPIYDILCTMMALQGFAFAKTDTEWRIVMCEDGAKQNVRNALARCPDQES